MEEGTSFFDLNFSSESTWDSKAKFQCYGATSIESNNIKFRY